MSRKSIPGVSKDQRLSDEGLQRLEKQLTSGARISQQVLAQWIKRYGKAAVEIIKKHGSYNDELEQ